ncbi:MAG: metal ABC transporter permease, partial [Ezakiella coagulans]
LIVLPVATTLISSRSYKSTLIITTVLGIIYMMSGIAASYYFDIKPGGAIIVAALLGMLAFWISKKIRVKQK